ncbi:Zinc knuckle CX2CX4HX4C [Corchorus olitorius]|uniref:Zinc knuckle CX2CX4HX4C n=1 Tax=Corchorus olitorius TaxID=93759 RepID=A0A1R3I4I2_9ROSI|nr:Zinc knuckle CX2CX4HX4C [Corchorus olitorius]
MDDFFIELYDKGSSRNQDDDWVLVGKVITERLLNKTGVRAILRNLWPETDAPSIGEIHNLPREMMTKSNGEKIGRNLGTVIEVEEPRGSFGLNRGFLRVKVSIDFKKPLLARFWFPCKANDRRWAELQYEKLGDYCYECGRLGHKGKFCKFRSAEIEGRKLYGPHLRIGLVRSLLKNAKREEVKLIGNGDWRAVKELKGKAVAREAQVPRAREEIIAGKGKIACDLGAAIPATDSPPRITA